ncbi:MAG: taurine dioxygenase [Rhodospirillaceae bacterium TMED8]|nr:taurine dioxygenase [Magnetovibrio sp.]OUT47850.1 MAG: taurine dioxygenase [Rhodospirillaceae bacterium TMED8]|tara:strand:- start:1208 stop:2068 length:861 start_codon:yes stop_codon:yes gene_type:complete
MSAIEVQPISGALGAEILNVDLSEHLNNDQFNKIHQAFLDNLVVFFRDQDLTPGQHVRFAKRFGELDIHKFIPGLPENPELIPVIKSAGDTNSNFGGIWHTDVSFQEQPALGSLLYGRKVPEYGGDTIFSNMYLAYERLSNGLKRTIADLRAIHTAGQVYGVDKRQESIQRFAYGDESMNVRFGADAEEEVSHPVVRIHPETGKKSLFVNEVYTTRFEGWTIEESAGLLKFLFNWSTRPDFTCRFRWQQGSMAFWDNRCVQHYALDDYYGFDRIMHRATIRGDKPV